jgi:hypothetical protein
MAVTNPKPVVPVTPKPPAPSRPPMRTTPLAPPKNTAIPDGVVAIPRSPWLFGLGIALNPSPLNQSEADFMSNPMYNNTKGFNEGVEDIDTKGDYAGDVYFNSRPDAFVPRLGVPQHGLASSPDQLPLLQAGIPAQVYPGRKELDDYDPYGEEAARDYAPQGSGRPLGWSSDYIHKHRSTYRSPEAIAALRGVLPQGAPLALPEALPQAVPPGKLISEEFIRANPYAMNHHALFSVTETAAGPRFSARLKLDRAEKIHRPRRGDEKGQRKMIGLVNMLVTRSYGLVTELHDAAEVFGWSLYGKGANGRTLPAMALEHHSLLGVMRGYLEGRYKLDAVGFAIDFGINQTTDIAYAVESRLEVNAAIRFGGHSGYLTQKIGSSRAQPGSPGVKGKQDYVSETISSAAAYVRSFDVQRKARIAALWR